MGKRSRFEDNDLSSSGEKAISRIVQRQPEPISSTADSDDAGVSGTQDTQDRQDDLPGSAPQNHSRRNDELHVSPHDAKRRRLNCVLAQGPAYPLSAHHSDGKSPTPFGRGSEARIIDALKETHNSLHASAQLDYTYFRLENFSIYRPQGQTASDRHGGELVTLHRLLRHGDGSGYYLVDGTLTCGDEHHQIKGVPFSILTIDGYGDAAFSVRDKICVQSTLAQRADVWYQLGTPAPEYMRFYKPFLWLAHFSKCFVEYLLETEEVALHHFARDALFINWLQQTYGGNAEYEVWRSESGLRQFRTTVAAHVGFLHKEAYSIDQRLCKKAIWGEIDPLNLTAIPAEPHNQQRTVVTPFAHDMFRHMYFGSQLKSVPMDPLVKEQVKRRKQQLGLAPLVTDATRTPPVDALPSSQAPPTPFCEGDVVTIKADHEGAWKKSSDIWYAYIQKVRVTPTGNVRLDVLWMYQPRDTTLGAAYYPFANELFLSDNCSCGRDALSPDDIISKVEVEWGGPDPAAEAGLFVRQKFCTVAEEDRYSFETLKDVDYRCGCDQTVVEEWEKCLREYDIHDTVLVLRFRLTSSDSIRLREEVYQPGEEILAHLSNENLTKLDGVVDGWLDPAELVGFDHETETVEVRPFRRVSEDTSGAAANELVLGGEKLRLPTSRIARKCHVRIFDDARIRESRIPAPYDRGGAADCYFLSKGVREGWNGTWPTFKLGFDPAAPRRKLRGMGIFCGGGNLDRGLEDSGVAEFDYAVDWAEHALHSYRAASQNPTAHYFLGSVDDYLALALAGSTKVNIARIGAVELFTAGSPCPGFSALNGNKLSEQSLKNASMVASVVAYVDFYSPKYFVLENVVTMTQGMGAKKDENVFSQVLASLVALGYQVQQFLMDAWSYGSCQQRSRVFIIASAPGLQPLSAPAHTHDHPSNTPFKVRTLGRSSNGLPFGKRRDEFVPFSHVSLAEACKDLPFIGDAQTRLCTTFPDHRTPTDEKGTSRSRIAMVPVLPEGMGLVQAVRAGHVTGGEPHEFFTKLGHLQLTKSSTTYARLHPDGLVPTLTTALRIRDGVAGRTLHWAEQRSISVMECRRAQGYQDDEVLVGTTFQQMKIIGNSVDRMVSLALGMALKTSWAHSEGGELHHSTHALCQHRQSAERLAASPALVSEQLVSLFTPPLTPPRVAAGEDTGTGLTDFESSVPQYRRDRDVLPGSDHASLHSEDQDIDVAPVESEDAENSSARVRYRNSTEVLPSRPHPVFVIRRSQQSQASSTRDLTYPVAGDSADMPNERLQRVLEVRPHTFQAESLDQTRSVDDAHKHRGSRSGKPSASTQDHVRSMATVAITETAPELPASPPLTPPEFESQDAPLKLSDAQVQEIRTDGFKAILRMLDSWPRR
ncbi:hypothetical protein LTR10_013940 [Elasticomyces elasticus]|nr:hypothetical protein LTR10_013940 [Elasticomyces elasticus]KAK4974478.1 hypothetical protein LTR42_005123 [Elasticomyces elasticus]